MVKAILTFLIAAILIFTILPDISQNALADPEHSDFNIFSYIIPVTADQTPVMEDNISILVNELLNNEITTYWLAENLKVLSIKQNEDNNPEIYEYLKGSFIIPITDNVETNILIDSIVENFNINYHQDFCTF